MSAANASRVEPKGSQGFGGNAKLRKLVADLPLDREMLQDVIRQKTVKPDRKRKLVDERCGDWDVSIRRACRVLEVDTFTYQYKARRHDQAGIEPRIKEMRATLLRGDQGENRIASPEMLPTVALLLHLICSSPVFAGGGEHEADQHDDA